ncbi:hypothetical protein RHSIM_Rhsim02G0183400 [Rhododendron simsii]|uniref:Uncharacterized protein n=1 Tax=Rhododendron simsii TaxID=118357 RepID=A0A834LU06_RHOSS|nr:hypothetical protein RHSIM_Rhsim02G0183400 [Rhododendron simsii]
MSLCGPIRIESCKRRNVRQRFPNVRDLPNSVETFPSSVGTSGLVEISQARQALLHSSASSYPKLGGNLPKLDGDLPKHGGNLPKLGSNLPRLGGNLPRLGRNLSRLGEHPHQSTRGRRVKGDFSHPHLAKTAMSSFMHHRSGHDRRSTLLGWRVLIHLLLCHFICRVALSPVNCLLSIAVLSLS